MIQNLSNYGFDNNESLYSFLYDCCSGMTLHGHVWLFLKAPPPCCHWIGLVLTPVGPDSLGPTLLSLGSVQTFCIDPLEEVFGVEVRTGAVVAGGMGGITLAMTGQVTSKSRKGQPPGTRTTCSGNTPPGSLKRVGGSWWMVRCVVPYFYWNWFAIFRHTAL
jgi:hypothetical protein